MTLALSAIICTHNPRPQYLSATLDALARQDIDPSVAWELIVIDNASEPPLIDRLDLSWRPGARVIREDRLGLTHARIRGFREAKGEILLYIDDDNVLDDDYVRQVVDSLQSAPGLGAIGGKAIPRYETQPPEWFAGLGLDLACRDLGDAPLHADWRDRAPAERDYPTCAPIGAGMAIRRHAYAAFVAAIEADPVRQALGRKGADLASGEDNDMILSLLEQGWGVAYLPQLRLEHQIPARRVGRDYLAAYAYSTNLTWVQVLAAHGLRPWPGAKTWTAPLRKARAYMTMAAWRSDAAFIRWRGACGLIDGRTRLP